MGKVKLYNKGGRKWIVKDDDGKEVVIQPGRFVEIGEKRGGQLKTDYPRDFSNEAETGAGSSKSEAAAKKKADALTKENKALKAELEALKKGKDGK